MKVFGLDVPRLSHRQALGAVLGSLALLLGFGATAWLAGTALDRESAIALFVGFLYIQLADPLLAGRDARVKRYALVASGAGMLVATAAIIETLI